GYAPTPLHALDSMARSAGVRSLYYKDEGARFEPGSFKALGGAYAVQQLLRREIGRLTGESVTLLDVRTQRFADQAARVTVATATDGNHGRSVAWGAQRFGCRCVIYIHREVSEGRRRAMESYGAEVVRVDGNYDDSVRRAQADATENGWFIVSDTSYPGYTDLPRHVMAGYTLMIKEALDQLPAPDCLSHVFLQGGCGGLAAAVAAYLWRVLGERRPRLIIVEPVQADCLYRSAASGRRVDVDIQEESLMAGLSCGEVSMLGWQVIEPAVRDFVTLDDTLIAPTMRMLAAAADGARIVAGESAVPGLAVLLAASRQAELGRALSLDAESRILALGTEGATDTEIYRELTGMEPLPRSA
ncbi:MAG TPA: diaminopropionate ammonia-lyase, partial [Arenicellales bacterium]|nr:diaminopropionate ammonia-lyase [Arenicellales bacterium]